MDDTIKEIGSAIFALQARTRRGTMTAGPADGGGTELRWQAPRV